MIWGLDLDGVVWRGSEAIPGSADAIARIHAAGDQVIYVTNNSALGATGYVTKLESCGIAADVDQIVHGGHAVAGLVAAGENVLLCAGEGVREAVAVRGANGISIEEFKADQSLTFDAVIVGWRPDFGYDILSFAVRGVLGGARLLAPSSDPLYPGNDGVSMGGGSLTAAVAYATGATATFAAKPYQPIVDVITSRFGKVDIVVGDQPATDGALAQRLGSDFYLVESGVAAHTKAANVPVVATLPDLSSVVDHVLDSRS